MLEATPRSTAHGAAVPRRRRPCALFLALVPSACATVLAPAPACAAETATAREQARLCERLSGADAVTACRAALRLGIGPERRDPLRELLAKQLVALERWDELAELFRDEVRRDPQDADAWQRLGATLLFALNLPAESVGALEQAVQLAPQDVDARVTLGLALAASGRYVDAVTAFDQALRRDPLALDDRPAARATLDAAREGRSWP
jgi:tetratricopeptide (TPR) repeat protein